MKKALLFLSLLSFFGFAACNDKSDEEEKDELFSISYDVVWYSTSASATDIVIFEMDEKRNEINRKTIPYIPQCGRDAERRTLNTTSNVVQVEVYHKSAGQCYLTYRDFRNYNNNDVALSDDKITQEQYDNATQQ